MILMPLDRGRIVVVHLSSTNFFRVPPTVDITKCRSPKNGKNWGFSTPEGDKIN